MWIGGKMIACCAVGVTRQAPAVALLSAGLKNKDNQFCRILIYLI
jgi:rhodanese-related sulfurtransferase